MEKLMELYKKYGNYVLAGATAYWLVMALVGDLIFTVFAVIGLGIVARLLYLVVGLVGVVKLIEMFKPELLEKAKGKNKPKSKE